jgi:hypothetical protein
MVQQAVTAEYPHRQWKIEGRAFLLHIGRREVDGDCLIRKSKTRLLRNRRNDPATGFPNGRIGQSRKFGTNRWFLW